MKKYFKIANRNIATAKPRKEITQGEFDDMIITSSFAEEKLGELTDEELENGEMDEKANEIFEEAYRQAQGDGFDAGNYYIYIGDEDFDMWEVSRR